MLCAIFTHVFLCFFLFCFFLDYAGAVQVPVMIKHPDYPQNAGKHTQTFLELIDIYRTIASLAGLNMSALQADVAGMDQSQAVRDPTSQLKDYAFAQYSRCPGNRNWPHGAPGHPDWYLNNCEGVPSQNISYMVCASHVMHSFSLFLI